MCVCLGVCGGLCRVCLSGAVSCVCVGGCVVCVCVCVSGAVSCVCLYTDFQIV